MGTKLERVADEFTSSDFQIAKDRAGPLFLSRETDTLFILTAHLKGYSKRDIKIEISEDGTIIVISGEKAIQGTVIVGSELYKKETVIRGFGKAFKIPEGVILDKIRAKFEEDKSILTISMPKKETGVRGIIVEEAKEQELARAGSGKLQVAVNHEFPPEHSLEEGISREEEASFKESKESLERVEPKKTQKPIIDDMKEQAKNQPGNAGRPEKVPEEHEHEIETIEGTKYLADEVTEGSGDPSAAVKPPEGSEEHTPSSDNEENGRCNPCTIAAGSALLVSLVVFVIHFIRNKSQPGKRKD